MISSGGKNSLRCDVRSVVAPHSQYAQLYEHVLKGMRSIPRDRPSRLEMTGPKMW